MAVAVRRKSRLETRGMKEQRTERRINLQVWDTKASVSNERLRGETPGNRKAAPTLPKY
jgi:hypothetical protein